jgi:hypothetical protein
VNPNVQQFFALNFQVKMPQYWQFLTKLFRNPEPDYEATPDSEENFLMTNVIDLSTGNAHEPEPEMVELVVWVAYDDQDFFVVASDAEEAADDLRCQTEGHQQRLVKVTVRVPKLVPLEAIAE